MWTCALVRLEAHLNAQGTWSEESGSLMYAAWKHWSAGIGYLEERLVYWSVETKLSLQSCSVLGMKLVINSISSHRTARPLTPGHARAYKPQSCRTHHSLPTSPSCSLSSDPEPSKRMEITAHEQATEGVLRNYCCCRKSIRERNNQTPLTFEPQHQHLSPTTFRSKPSVSFFN